jgi:hypothetical protein
MTACCCRLTQPATSRQKKASGGGNGSMAEACPRPSAGSRAMSIRPYFPEVQALVGQRQSANCRVIGRRRSFRT